MWDNCLPCCFWPITSPPLIAKSIRLVVDCTLGFTYYWFVAFLGQVLIVLIPLTVQWMLKTADVPLFCFWTGSNAAYDTRPRSSYNPGFYGVHRKKYKGNTLKVTRGSANIRFHKTGHLTQNSDSRCQLHVDWMDSRVTFPGTYRTNHHVFLKWTQHLTTPLMIRVRS